MAEFFSGSGYFAVMLSLLCYCAADLLQKKFRSPLLNPIAVSAALVILVLQVLDIPNEVYQSGCQVLTYLLTPATLCLAISFYEQFQRLKQHLGAIALGVAGGCLASFASVWALCRFFGLDRTLLLSLLPKSVTTAIGAALSEELGGIAAVSTAIIILTGIVGNMAGPLLCRWLRLSDPIAQGVAFGTASHVIGTARAKEMSELAGAVSSLALTLSGLVTAVLLSGLAQFL